MHCGIYIPTKYIDGFKIESSACADCLKQIFIDDGECIYCTNDKKILSTKEK